MTEGHASAVLAASIFHFGTHSIAEAKAAHGRGRHSGEADMTDTLARLFATIEARAGADPAASHTAALLAKGPAKCAEKFGEEAVEAIVAAAARRPRRR